MVTHITQNVKYNSVTLLLGYNQIFFHPEVLDFLPIYFHTFCPYLESLTCFHGKYLIVQSLYVQGQKSRVEVSSWSCHLK